MHAEPPGASFSAHSTLAPRSVMVQKLEPADVWFVSVSVTQTCLSRRGLEKPKIVVVGDAPKVGICRDVELVVCLS
jgi:hypothetical protein